MKYTLLIAVLALAGGCARFKTVQTDVRYDEKGAKTTEITTRASATTFFAGKQALAQWSAEQSESTQGAQVGGLESEVEGAGEQLGVIVKAVTEGAIAAMK